MQRRTASLLLVGWLLGLLTSLAWPAVSIERKTIVAGRFEVGDRVVGWTRAGWIVTGTTTIDRSVIVQLERPRYLGIAEGAALSWRDLSDWLRGVPPPMIPTPAPSKPTEAPKPAATAVPRSP